MFVCLKLKISVTAILLREYSYVSCSGFKLFFLREDTPNPLPYEVDLPLPLGPGEAASINIKFIGIDGHLDTLYYEDELKFLNYETETSGSIKKIHGGK